jgi:hypothetical protein
MRGEGGLDLSPGERQIARRSGVTGVAGVHLRLVEIRFLLVAARYRGSEVIDRIVCIRRSRSPKTRRIAISEETFLSRITAAGILKTFCYHMFLADGKWRSNAVSSRAAKRIVWCFYTTAAD